MNKSLELLKQQTAVAHYDNPWLEAADEAGSGFGKMLKFVKGEWLINEGIVPEGAEYIVFIDEVARGYIKFEDKTVTDATRLATRLLDRLERKPQQKLTAFDEYVAKMREHEAAK
jgi:hypothetical protein